MVGSGLAQIFTSMRPEVEPTVALEAQLEALWQAGTAAWPSVAIGAPALTRWVAARTHDPHAVAVERGPDWLIACACAAGLPAAITVFETHFWPSIAPAVRRAGLDASGVEEARQKVMAELFVASPGEAPRIAQYSGRGELAGWLRVTAVRSALKLVRERRDTPVEDEQLLARIPVADDDPDLTYMKELYRPAFKAAFQDALDSLTSREQNLLRQHLLDGLSIDQLGGMYQVHRATAARWVAEARDLLMRRTRTSFQRRVRIGNEECDSIMRMIESQLGVTLRRRLDGSR